MSAEANAAAIQDLIDMLGQGQLLDAFENITTTRW